MRTILFISLFLFSIGTMTSCTKETDIPVPELAKKPVVNCIFSPDSILKVKLLESQTYELIKNGTVQLFLDSQFVKTLTYDTNGIYEANGYYPMPNHEYSLHINTDRYKNIYAEDSIPTKVPIIKLTYHDSAGVDEIDNMYASLELTFQDPPDEKNYYEVAVYSTIDTSTLELIDTTGLSDTSWSNFLEGIKQELSGKWTEISSYDPVIKTEGFSTYSSNLFFNDQMINGEKYTLTINYNPYYDYANTYKVHNQKLIVYFRSISRNYYLYRKKELAYDQYANAGIWKNLNDFVRLYSNVENGYGLFAGYQVSVDTLSLNH